MFVHECVFVQLARVTPGRYMNLCVCARVPPPYSRPRTGPMTGPKLSRFINHPAALRMNTYS